MGELLNDVAASPAEADDGNAGLRKLSLVADDEPLTIEGCRIVDAGATLSDGPPHN